MITRIRAQLPVWRRALRRRRRTLAALAVALVVALTVPAFLPPGIQGTTVVVASEDLPGGTVLGADHLRTLRVASDLVPPGTASSIEELVGSETATPVPAGSPVLAGALSGGDSSVIPAGSALVAVPVPAAVTAHLSPGSRLEIVSSVPEAVSPRRIPARVVAPASPGGSDDSLLDPGTSAQPQVLVTVDREDTVDLARSSAEGWLSVSLIG